MTPKRYQQIGVLFDEALERPLKERAAWLEQACGNDATLRAEVEKLLAHHQDSESFLNVPALNVAANLLAQTQTPIKPGQRISHYEILSLLGAGGMGEVYLAKDLQLGRQVALKILPRRLQENPEYLRRFEREALAASALNHPNILTIYEFSAATIETGQTYLLASEYVKGENLRQRLSRGPMPLATVLDLTMQIAAALQAAHAVHIIHRDIKPDNLMVRDDGIVKVLDFGLAKLLENLQGERAGLAERQPSSLTLHGTILGTAAYMSPEQARGLTLDGRTDLFSLGVVFYEMLTGRQPFSGETINHTIVAILEQEPPPLELPQSQWSSDLERILQRLLAKKAEDRFVNAAALLDDLKQLAKRLDHEDHQSYSLPQTEAATKPLPNATNEQFGVLTKDIPQQDLSLRAVDLAHVLFCDIVHYSLLPIDQQTSVMQTLQQIVRNTNDYQRADQKGQLVRLPAGDGMALAFLQDVTAPVRCALDITQALKAHPDIPLRIGIHSGPVFQSADINAVENVVGTGVNMAQRVMDFGDAGHILLSHNVADVLLHVSYWKHLLHDLGEHEAKHGVKIHLYNLYDQDFGNAALPKKLAAQQETTKAPIQKPETTTASAFARRKLLWVVGALFVLTCVSLFAWLAFHSRALTEPATTALPLRQLSYFLTVQKYRDGRPYQAEFQSSGREIFEPGWQFKLNITSPQDGFLYLLNEEPDGHYVLLFPIPTRNNGSALLAASERFQTNWYLFDEKVGTERFRLIWAAQPVPALEAIRRFVNPTEKGRVTDPALEQAVKSFINQASTAPLEKVHSSQDRQTQVSGHSAVLVALVELEHH